MHKIVNACIETLEGRTLLASAFGTDGDVRYIGPTTGVTAAANPSTTGISVESAGNGGTGAADLDTAINLDLLLNANGGAKETSFLKNQFAIFEDVAGTQVETSKVQTSGGGDALRVKPLSLLKPNTTYVVRFNQRNDLNKITNVANEPFTAATYTFTTGTFFNQGTPEIKFTKQIVAQKQNANNADRGAFSAVAIGPDHRLYVGTLEGYIYRYNIAADGTLAGETRIEVVRNNNGGARFITGLTFDPRSTDPNNPVLWVSHGQAKFGDNNSTGSDPLDRADNYTGKISRIYGANFQTYQDVIVNIPRSVKDHLNNQISFDPASRNLFFLIPSHSAMGRADPTWGNRPEEESTAAMFRLQLRTRGNKVGIEAWLAANGPINLDPASKRKYNFFKGTNPLRFYATGIRNAYDMVWHSNGRLYVPANSSAAGGYTPDDPGQGGNQAVTNVQQTIDDYLFDVAEGGYYGHPNPTRGQYILNGGNPTGGTDVNEVRAYPVGTQPDANYRGAAYNFGQHQSPNGVLEYKSDTFGGRLKGSLLVARYGDGADVLILKPRADGTFTENDDIAGTTGLTGLITVLDIVEDTTNGNLYSITLDDRFGKGTVRLHKPKTGVATLNKTRVGMYLAPGGEGTGQVTLTNTSPDSYLNLDSSAIRITGVNRRNFVVTNFPAGDPSLAPGESITFNIKVVSPGPEVGTKFGNLAIATDDARGRYIAVVPLRGFVESGVAPSSLAPASLAPAPQGAADRPASRSAASGLFGDQAIDEEEAGLLLL